MNYDDTPINAGELLRILEKKRDEWEVEKEKAAHMGLTVDEARCEEHIRGIIDAMDEVKDLAR